MQYKQITVIVGFISLFFIVLMMSVSRTRPLNILAFGDSLTAGYYNYGARFHPYASHLTRLFESANIPVKITQQGVSGELVVPSMTNRLRSTLEKDTSYDWIIILGGTNDLGYGFQPERIFNEGLEKMYEMCLNYRQGNAKLAAMTVIENAIYAPTKREDQRRQKLNQMIRDYVDKVKEQNRVFLVDLDKGIPYHSLTNNEERQKIWDDSIHLTPAGYDRMATLIFEAIKDEIK